MDNINFKPIFHQTNIQPIGKYTWRYSITVYSPDSYAPHLFKIETGWRDSEDYHTDWLPKLWIGAFDADAQAIREAINLYDAYVFPKENEVEALYA